MNTMTFRPLTESDLKELTNWHRDAELSNRIGGKDWPNKFWELIQKDHNRSCLIVEVESQPVGYMDFEEHPNEKLAWMGLAVKPDLRNQGLGKRILQNFLQLPHVKVWPEIRAGIEEDNIASKKCFMSLGFVPIQEKADDEGIIDFSFRYQCW